MNIKKILAASTASVLAVSAMAVVASAGEMTCSFGFNDDESAGNYQLLIGGDNAVSEAAGLDVTKIASFDLTLSFDDKKDEGNVDEDGNPVFEWAGGAVVVQSDSLNHWTELGAWENAEGNGKKYENVESGKSFHVDLGDKVFTAEDTYAAVTLQSYGIVSNIDAITFYDATGAVLLALPAAEPPAESTPAESTPAESTPAESTGDDTKTPVETGVKGVAAVLGVAVVAAGAMVVAKKRK